jgi:signal transduction histidine kinase
LPTGAEHGKARMVLRSMRVRIVAATVLLIAASAMVSIMLMRGVLRDRLDEEIVIDLQQEAEEFGLLATGLNPETGLPFGGDIEAVFDVYFAREVPDEGESLLAFIGDDLYASARAPDALPAGSLRQAIEYWRALDNRTVGSLDTSGGETRFVALPIAATPDTPDGALFVVANFPAFERGEIDEAVRVQAITQFATIVVASMVGLALAGRVLRPLRALADTARTITETDLTQRIDVQGNDEASDIARAFNEMLERLESAFATQRAFLDDVSHELRVPLAVVRGNVEVLDLVEDEAERGEMIAVATAEIERMNRIVEDLLLLARAERPGFLTLETVDLGDLVGDIHRRAVALGDRDWRLEASGSTGRAQLDPQRVTQAMMQLADNACQHTDPGDIIRIGAHRSNDLVTFWVHDSGPGIPLEEAERVFQRHARGISRRAGSGLGLGLSIVSTIAAAHGGLARAAASTKGARVEIELPLYSAGGTGANG